MKLLYKANKYIVGGFMNSVCIECKECDYYLPVENNIRPIGSNKLNINSTYIINNLFKTIKKIIIIFTINVLLKMFAKMCD